MNEPNRTLQWIREKFVALYFDRCGEKNPCGTELLTLNSLFWIWTLKLPVCFAADFHQLMRYKIAHGASRNFSSPPIRRIRNTAEKSKKISWSLSLSLSFSRISRQKFSFVHWCALIRSHFDSYETETTFKSKLTQHFFLRFKTAHWNIQAELPKESWSVYKRDTMYMLYGYRICWCQEPKQTKRAKTRGKGDGELLQTNYE